MPTRDEAFPSKYFKASDLTKGPIVLKIKDAQQETLKGFNGELQDKTVLHFAGTRKILPLNRTNWDAVVDVTGRVDSNDWCGHQVELFATTTEMNGTVKPCVRIRTPMVRAAAPRMAKVKKDAATAPGKAADDFSDEIPFEAGDAS